MAAIKSFRDLVVYQRAREEAGNVFRTSRKFPPEGKYALTDQIRRSSRAVNALLAEAWARRRYRAAFINKINEAMGEAMETQAWLDHAIDAGYLSKSDFERLDAAWQDIGGKLQRMIDKADTFCPKPSD